MQFWEGNEHIGTASQKGTLMWCLQATIAIHFDLSKRGMMEQCCREYVWLDAWLDRWAASGMEQMDSYIGCICVIWQVRCLYMYTHGWLGRTWSDAVDRWLRSYNCNVKDAVSLAK